MDFTVTENIQKVCGQLFRKNLGKTLRFAIAQAHTFIIASLSSCVTSSPILSCLVVVREAYPQIFSPTFDKGWARTFIYLFLLSSVNKKRSEQEGKEADMNYIVWLDSFAGTTRGEVGNKVEALAALATGFPVPQGFVIKTNAHELFLNLDNSLEVQHAATRIQKIILQAPFPLEFARELHDAYNRMNVKITNSAKVQALGFLKLGEKCDVAIRSCPVSGQKELCEEQEFMTFLNVIGVEQLRRAILGCYASLFSTKNIQYRLKNKVFYKRVMNAILVQKMIHSDKSGILLTSSQEYGGRCAEVTAIWGLGKGLGNFKGDHYVLHKDQKRIVEMKVAPQPKAFFCSDMGKVIEHELPEQKYREQRLGVSDAAKLIELSRNIEALLGIPQRIEFAFDGPELHIIGLAPLTSYVIPPEAKEKAGAEWIPVEKIHATMPDTEQERYTEMVGETVRPELLVRAPTESVETVSPKTMNAAAEQITTTTWSVPVNVEAANEIEIEEYVEQPQVEKLNPPEEGMMDERIIQEASIQESPQPVHEGNTANEMNTMLATPTPELETHGETISQPQHSNPEPVPEQSVVEESLEEYPHLGYGRLITEPPSEFAEREVSEVVPVEAPQALSEILNVSEPSTANTEEKRAYELHEELVQEQPQNMVSETQESKNMPAPKQQEQLWARIDEQVRRHCNLYPHARKALLDFAEEIKREC